MHLCCCALQVKGTLSRFGADSKAVAFVTDWGSNMLKAGERLQEILPSCLTNVGCLQHLLSNALKDFAKEPELSAVIALCKELMTYINSHTATRAIYDEQKVALGGTALIKAGGTRFGTNVLSMESVSNNE